MEDIEKRRNNNLPRFVCLLAAIYLREIHKPTLTCEKRRKRHLLFIDYIERKKELLLLQREGLL
jgi:hypothetical protein